MELGDVYTDIGEITSHESTTKMYSTTTQTGGGKDDVYDDVNKSQQDDHQYSTLPEKVNRCTTKRLKWIAALSSVILGLLLVFGISVWILHTKVEDLEETLIEEQKDKKEMMEIVENLTGENNRNVKKQNDNQELLMELVQNLNDEKNRNIKVQIENRKMITNLVKNVTDLNSRNNKLPTTCAGIPVFVPVVILANGYTAVCDTRTDGGGWLIIQRRSSSDVDFFRGWKEYKDGFGELYGNFWYGLEKVHTLTSLGNYELRVDMRYKGKAYYAQYDNFRISGEDDKYKLKVSGYHGNAGDSLTGGHSHNNMYFSTRDSDNDESHDHCAEGNHGAWWYNACQHSNLNGDWENAESYKGLRWYTLTDADGVTFSEMKIRPVDP